MERVSIQHSVSEDDTNSGPESPPTDTNVRPWVSTNRTIEYLDSDSSVYGDFTPYTNGSLVSVESRPNSGPENSTTRVPLHTITQDAVLEHYVLTRAIEN